MSFHYEVVERTAAVLSSKMDGSGRLGADRIASIDLLRGLVMVVMALDHVRDFFGQGGLSPRDVADPALFLTRWITHFCAPVFIFLAGLSAYLHGMRRESIADTSRFLLTRGLWLIVLEFTVVKFGWMFGFGSNFWMMQVIWAIGVSMVVLAALVWLPLAAIGVIAIAMIAGHNLLDGIHAADFGSVGWLWNVLHEPALVSFGQQLHVRVLYPLIPWIGVMAAGYAAGPVFKRPPQERTPLLIGLGAVVTVGFVVLRLSGVYGDPAPWKVHQSTLSTALSILDLEKYPPSLLYLMMTLGPALLLLAAFERARGRLADWISTFGRVPLFYYVAHIYLIHVMAIAAALAIQGDASWLTGGRLGNRPANWGFGLPIVYAVWLLVIITLQPVCRWFADVKRGSSSRWLSYF